MGKKDWTCTNSWLQLWKTRHGLVFKKMHGERASVDEKSTDAWVKDILRPTLDRYKDDDVYNVDETGLFWKLLPDRTFALKGETCAGVKISRERVTIMLCCNMTGTDKRHPISIGKYANPRCYKHIKKDFPVQYDSNGSAWMTTEIFKPWLNQFDRDMERQNRKVLLVMDNCSSHKLPDLHSVEVLFLPPNATSKLQPLDAGIIQNFKVKYRRSLCLKLLACIEGGEDTYKPNLLDALYMTTQSWEKVTADTIAHCFRNAAFRHSSDDQATSDSELCLEKDHQEVEPLLSGLFEKVNVDPSDYFNVDDMVITEDPALDAAEGPSTSRFAESYASSEEEDEEMPKVSSKEAMASSTVISNFCRMTPH